MDVLSVLRTPDSGKTVAEEGEEEPSVSYQERATREVTDMTVESSRLSLGLPVRLSKLSALAALQDCDLQ